MTKSVIEKIKASVAAQEAAKEAPLPSNLPLGVPQDLSVDFPLASISEIQSKASIPDPFPFVRSEVVIESEEPMIIEPEPVVCTDDYEAMSSRSGYVSLKNGFGPGVRVKMTPEEAMKVNHLRQELNGEKLLDGSPIESNLDVFRYLLCQVE